MPADRDCSGTGKLRRSMIVRAVENNSQKIPFVVIRDRVRSAWNQVPVKIDKVSPEPRGQGQGISRSATDAA